MHSVYPSNLPWEIWAVPRGRERERERESREKGKGERGREGEREEERVDDGIYIVFSFFLSLFFASLRIFFAFSLSLTLFFQHLSLSLFLTLPTCNGMDQTDKVKHGGRS